MDTRRFIDRLDSAERKQYPIATGLIDYAPDAVAAIAHISYLGNEKHNPGQPLHHARGKSMDHPDCIARHLSTRNDVDPAYAADILAPVFHQAETAWRAIMLLQETMERVYGLPMAPAARAAEPVNSLPREPSPLYPPFFSADFGPAVDPVKALADDFEYEQCESRDGYGGGVRCILRNGHDGGHNAGPPLPAVDPAPLANSVVVEDFRGVELMPDTGLDEQPDTDVTLYETARGFTKIGNVAPIARHQSSASCKRPAPCETCVDLVGAEIAAPLDIRAGDSTAHLVDAEEVLPEPRRKQPHRKYRERADE